MAIINPGLDASGNSNNWVPVNIDFYTGTSPTYDVMTDVPTNTSATVANFCVMNPLFSNKIGHIVGVGAESEVTRIDTKAVAGTVWIPQEVIEGAKLVLEIQELIKQAKIKTPQIKVAVPVTLKKGK